MTTTHVTSHAAPSPLAVRSGDGVEVMTGRRHRFRLVSRRLHVRLDVNPDDPRTHDDRFTLVGGDDPDAPAWSQVRTVRDDQVRGDERLDLVYTGLDPSLRYWLVVDTGAEGECYYVFEEVPFAGFRTLSEVDAQAPRG